MVMMLKSTPDDKPDAREKLKQQIAQLETEIKKLQASPQKPAKKKQSSSLDMNTVIIVLIGVIVVFGVALGTGILIQ